MKKVLSFILAALMLTMSFVSCNKTGGDTVTTADVTTATPTEAPEPVEPVDNSIKIYYDDRTTMAEILGKEVSSYELKNVEITSTVVGSDTKDTDLLTLDEKSGKLIATATGSAIIVADGEEYEFKVLPAPITIVLIIGHSLGMGSQGNAAQSVKCEMGQAYTSQLSDALFKNVNDSTGLGTNAPNRPANVDALCDGTGRQGTDGGIAFEWNRVSGEKIFVLNTAIGGSCVNQWIEGTAYHTNALRLLNSASRVVKNEVAAGHFEYRTTSVINFSSGNFYYQGVLVSGVKTELTGEEIKTWHESIWNGFQKGSTVDIDGDGTVDAPESIGYNPLWEANAGGLDKFNYDKHAIYYMAASDEYPHVFIASHDSRAWQTMDGITKTFPEIDYETQKTPVSAPTKFTDVSADNVHLTQLGYNAMGQEIARNLYAYLEKSNEPKTILIFNAEGKTVNSINVKVGATYKFAIVSNPVCASDLEITCDDNFTIDSEGVIKGVSAGTGKLTLSYNGEVIKSITVKTT